MHGLEEEEEEASVVNNKSTIVTGDQDNLVMPSNSVYLKKHMKEAEYLVFEKTGHAIHQQDYRKFNELLERTFREGREASEKMANEGHV